MTGPAAGKQHPADQSLPRSSRETQMDSSKSAGTDHDFVVAAHAGELGAEARLAADGAILDAQERGYEDDSARVAATIRAFMDS